MKPQFCRTECATYQTEMHSCAGLRDGQFIKCFQEFIPLAILEGKQYILNRCFDMEFQKSATCDFFNIFIYLQNLYCLFALTRVSKADSNLKHT